MNQYVLMWRGSLKSTHLHPLVGSPECSELTVAVGEQTTYWHKQACLTNTFDLYVPQQSPSCLGIWKIFYSQYKLKQTDNPQPESKCSCLIQDVKTRIRSISTMIYYAMYRLVSWTSFLLLVCLVPLLVIGNTCLSTSVFVFFFYLCICHFSQSRLIHLPF